MQLISNGCCCEQVRRVLESATALDLNTYQGDGPSLLMIEDAACKGSEASVRLLLEHGALVSAARQPLTSAAVGGNVEIVRLFLDLGASIEEKDALGRTTIMLAAMHGHESLVRFLLDLDAATDDVDKLQYSLLTCAVRGGLTETILLLLDLDFDLNEKTRHGDTLLMHAAEAKQPAVVQLLLELDIDVSKKNVVNDEGATLLMKAARGGDLESMLIFMDCDFTELDTRDKLGRNVMIHAAECGQEASIFLLLELGVMPRIADKNGKTPLMYAACNGFEGAMRMLLEHGARIDAENVNGRTAAMTAAAHGQVEAVRFLESYAQS